MNRILTFIACITVVAPPALAQESRAQGVLFTNVMVWDGSSENLRDADVLVTGNLISEISDEPLAVIASTDMTVIDGGGRTLMPGLIDSHVHLTHTFAEGGITAWEAMTWEEAGHTTAYLFLATQTTHG